MMDDYTVDIIAKFNLTPKEAQALHLISKGPTKRSDINKLLKGAYATTIMQKLELKGLVIKEHKPGDYRYVLYTYNGPSREIPNE